MKCRRRQPSRIRPDVYAVVCRNGKRTRNPMSVPLTQDEFEHQVEALFAAHGTAAFAAAAGELPARSLFVDGAQVVVETADSPRHRYGAFCELDRVLDAAALNDYVWHWLRGGEAYSLYLSMNVCRYRC